MNKTCMDILALSLVSGLGPRKISGLLEKTGDTEKIFSLSDSEIYEIVGKGAGIVSGIRSIRNSKEYASETARIKKEDIKILSYKDSLYPEILKHIYDPPAVFYYKGNLLPVDANAVAIIGSRRCSLYGLQMAEKLGCDLAGRGITVISGMARGIDSAAHRGALKAGGRTIAIMGSGFRYVYPPESGKLMKAISENGAVVTEYTYEIQPLRENFPRRNRIISGMSKGLVVVEAAQKSGAMITVNMALEQGREVFAVPGRADTYTSKGTNLLIQRGAKLVTSVDDVLEELNICEKLKMENEKIKTENIRDNDERIEIELSENDNAVLDILKKENAVHIDELFGCIDVESNKIPEILLKLELKGKIKALAGKQYVLR